MRSQVYFARILEILWLPFLVTSNKPQYEIALKSGRKVFVEFPADWCHSFSPPVFSLYAVSQSTRSILIRCSAHKAAKSVRPVCIGQEGAQHGPAEKLSARSNLRRDRVLAQPAVVLPRAVGVIESGLERQGDVFGKENFRSGAKRDPLIPVVMRIAVFGPLINKDWHNREPVVWLQQQMFGDHKSCRAIDKRRWVVDRRTEVAGRASSVPDFERVIPTVHSRRWWRSPNAYPFVVGI